MRHQDYNQVTFGVEIEFVARDKRSGTSTCSSHSMLALCKDEVARSGVPVVLFLPQSNKDRPNYTVWNVTEDISIEELTSSSESLLSQAPGHRVELVSPTYRIEDDWKSEIQKVLCALTESALFGVTVNRSTGLHIHMDLGDSGLSLDNLRCVAKAVVHFESGELPVSLSGPIEQSDNTTKVLSIVDE
jgi:hypothetical protein